MPKPIDDENEEKPLDPAVERVRRKLVRFVAINLGLLFAAVIVVIAAVVYRSTSARTPAAADIAVPSGEAIEADIPIPSGSRIVSQSWSGNRLSLQVEGINREQSLVVFDLAQRRVVARLRISWE
ncbi:MAG: fimbrial protein [Rhizobiales bacterium]|nr:fimbrial protein [Hyphomicrobiales bacterium]